MPYSQKLTTFAPTMKRLLIFTLLLFFAMTYDRASAQSIITTPERVDVGEVSRTKNVSFYLHNLTDSPVVITKVEATCGCTKIKYSSKPIPPRDSTELSLKYTADKQDVGVFYKTISIYTTAEQRPLKVSVRGTNKSK